MTRKRASALIIAAITWAYPSLGQAQNATPLTFELEEEKLNIEADIPSVDLIISFRELQERNQQMAQSFLDDIIETAKDEPF